MPEETTNKHFAETNQKFKDCCALADITPSKRQAAKFRNKTGIAYSHINDKKAGE